MDALGKKTWDALSCDVNPELLFPSRPSSLLPSSTPMLPLHIPIAPQHDDPACEERLLALLLSDASWSWPASSVTITATLPAITTIHAKHQPTHSIMPRAFPLQPAVQPRIHHRPTR